MKNPSLESSLILVELVQVELRCAEEDLRVHSAVLVGLQSVREEDREWDGGSHVDFERDVGR